MTGKTFVSCFKLIEKQTTSKVPGKSVENIGSPLRKSYRNMMEYVGNEMIMVGKEGLEL